jgi:hypothetical protein
MDKSYLSDFYLFAVELDIHNLYYVPEKFIDKKFLKEAFKEKNLDEGIFYIPKKYLSYNYCLKAAIKYGEFTLYIAECWVDVNPFDPPFMYNFSGVIYFMPKKYNKLKFLSTLFLKSQNKKELFKSFKDAFYYHYYPPTFDSKQAYEIIKPNLSYYFF